jgi:FkbM family methyltransferase
MIERIKNSINSRIETALNSFVKNRDIAKVFNCFLNFEKSNLEIIQIGSHQGQELRFYMTFFSTIHLIDPLIPQIKMHGLCKSKNVHLHSYAISSERGTREFFRASNKGESSSLLEPSHHLKEYPYIDFDRIKIEAKCLSDLSFFSSSDVMVLDVQGSELDVLNSAFPVGLNHLSVIICEYSLIPLYEKSADLSSLNDFLESLDFRLAFTTSPYISCAECTADAVFINKKLLNSNK